MARVYVSAVMNATLEEAWAFLRDFGALGNYHPYFENSYIEDGKPADQVGCVRRFTVRDGGGYLREQLLALSDDEHRCRYKILHIDAGQALSVQYHEVKDETVYLLSGEMKYWVKLPGEQELRDMHLRQGDAFRITPGTVHYMEAVTDCDVLEASTPELDDVVRIKDRYGREGTNAP